MSKYGNVPKVPKEVYEAQKRQNAPKDTEASTEHLFSPMSGGTGTICSCGKEFATTDLAQQHRQWHLDAQRVQLEMQKSGEKGTNPEASTCPWCKQPFIPRTAEEAMVGGHKQCPPVALERELREELITTLAYMYVYTEEGLNLSAEEWATRTVDRKILPLLTHTIEEAVVAAKGKVYFNYLDELIKLQPRQPEGDVLEAFDKATLAVARVTGNKDVVPLLEGLQETK